MLKSLTAALVGLLIALAVLTTSAVLAASRPAPTDWVTLRNCAELSQRVDVDRSVLVLAECAR